MTVMVRVYCQRCSSESGRRWVALFGRHGVRNPDIGLAGVRPLGEAGVAGWFRVALPIPPSEERRRGARSMLSPEELGELFNSRSERRLTDHELSQLKWLIPHLRREDKRAGLTTGLMDTLQDLGSERGRERIVCGACRANEVFLVDRLGAVLDSVATTEDPTLSLETLRRVIAR